MTKSNKQTLIIVFSLIILSMSIAGNIAQTVLVKKSNDEAAQNSESISKYTELQEKQIKAVKNGCKNAGIDFRTDEYQKRLSEALQKISKYGTIGNYDYSNIYSDYNELTAASGCYSALFALLGEESYDVTTERIIKYSSGSDPYGVDWTILEKIKY